MRHSHGASSRSHWCDDMPVEVIAEPSGSGFLKTATHTAVNVTTSSGAALAANANRKYALFINDSDTAIYLSLSGAAVLNAGVRLNANGGAFELSPKIGNMIVGAVTAIHGGSGNKVILVTEVV